MIRWSGPQPRPDGEQIANANDDLFPLAPTSEAPAEQTRANWAATLPDDTDVPLIWEDIRHGRNEEHPRHERRNWRGRR